MANAVKMEVSDEPTHFLFPYLALESRGGLPCTTDSVEERNASRCPLSG